LNASELDVGFQLLTDPDDVNALFAMTISVGMQADYQRPTA
jgi:hypothetical protein